MEFEQRYSDTGEEEIVLLQGKGCFWKKCRFCDYYLDSNSKNSISLNKRVLEQVIGKYKNLTVLNSGSFFELPKETKREIFNLLENKKITDLTIEAHLNYLDQVKKLKKRLKEKGINLHSRIGIETFNEEIREEVFNKGMNNFVLEKVSKVFDECCLLFGVKGQNLSDLEKDLKIATENFKKVFLNIYTPRKVLSADFELIEKFKKEVYPKVKSIPNLTILLNNTDLGVGD